MSGVFDLPYGFQVAPIAQYSTARPYSAIAAQDIDGDGRRTIDRVCAGTDIRAILSGGAAGATTRGCTQEQVNSHREGFIVRNGQIVDTISGRFFNVDLRLSKGFSIGERAKIKGYGNFFNIFNTKNLSIADRFGFSGINTGRFAQPRTLFGPGFGQPVGIPFTLQLGARVDF
jgi:hypothetical protein